MTTLNQIGFCLNQLIGKSKKNQLLTIALSEDFDSKDSAPGWPTPVPASGTANNSRRQI